MIQFDDHICQTGWFNHQRGSLPKPAYGIDATSLDAADMF